LLPHRPGTVATLGEAFGKAGVNIEGICGFDHEGTGIFHVLVTDRDAARRVVETFNKVGLEVRAEREVLAERVENRPGVLGGGHEDHPRCRGFGSTREGVGKVLGDEPAIGFHPFSFSTLAGSVSTG
jgi:hypothetical protein